MPGYAIITIPDELEECHYVSFTRFYHALGLNIGNRLFSAATRRLIAPTPTNLGFDFDPDEVNRRFEALIIPAANWINADTDLTFLADAVERIRIPVIMIGLGAQASELTDSVNPPEGTLRLIRAVAARSASISVRGAFTADALAALGIAKTRVTGCPSLYCDYRRFDPTDVAGTPTPKRVLLHATRFFARSGLDVPVSGVDRDIFQMAYRNKTDLLIQSEAEELAFLFGFETADVFDDKILSILEELYGAESWHSLRDFLSRHAKAFLNVDDWSAAMPSYDFVLGTRLHGTIMALNSGVPATLLWHDARTREMAEFAAIPSFPARAFNLCTDGVQALAASVDCALYYQRREHNRKAFHAFLRENGLTPALPN